MAESREESALQDVTNKMGASQIDAEAAKKAADHGWSEPTALNYDEINAYAEKKGSSDANPHWAANAQKYEWNDEFGDVGPVHEVLEKELFKNDLTVKRGQSYETLANIPVTCESKAKIAPIKKFEDAGLHPVLLRNIELCGYEFPTPIQAYVIPAVVQDHDVIGIAQTGSGKTAAYLIPVLSKLMGKAKKLAAPRPNVAQGWSRDQSVRAEPLILIIVPTRELASQIFDEARKLCYRSMLRPCVVYGGAPTGDQMDDLRKGCDLLVGTPGRMMDFIQRGNLLSLSRVRYSIIDEADEMITPDWQTEMDMLLGADNNDDEDHIYMMFSATFPKEARALAKDYMAKDHVRVRVGRAGSTHSNINQMIVYVEEHNKRQAVYDLLLSLEPARTMIFVNNKKAADFLDDYLYNLGLPCTSIHSDRTQYEREDAIRAFKNGKAPILIATGVSARGLDIKNVMHVINYDLPNPTYGGIHEYVHRIGRTARIGNVGQATSFYNERNEDLAEALAKLLKETGAEVPEFLQQYLQEGEDLDFDDKSDEEGEDGQAAGGASSGWSGGASVDAGGAWGAGPTPGKDAPAEQEPAAWGSGGDAPGGDSWGSGGGW